MPPYESDSDSDGPSDYQTTSALLGYASKEPTEDLISIIGGRPTWLDPAAPPSAALARCAICRDLMVQLLQLHGDLPEQFPTHERRLHVFACRRRTCKRKVGSVRALRTTRAAESEKKTSPEVPPPPPKEEPQRNLGNAIFGGGKLFGASTEAETLPVTFAAKARIGASKATSESSAVIAGPAPPPEPWPQAADLPPPYPSYFLDAAYEELDPDFSTAAAAAAEAAAKTAQKLESNGAEGSGDGSSKDDLDPFESTHDRTFQRFADRLAQNPEQVLRYEFRGTPLLYARDDAVGRLLAPAPSGPQGKVTTTGASTAPHIPACGRCGSQRVFEVQLVPQAIMELEANNDADGMQGVEAAQGAAAALRKTDAGKGAAAALDGMEWATIVVGVCARDCAGGAGECVHTEEWAGVQWEEERR